MNYSDQQRDVIYSRDNLIVNAVAGSGKTSTLARYAMERKDRPILYLTFNKISIFCMWRIMPLISNAESIAAIDVVLKDSVAPKAGKTYSYEEVRKSKPSAYSSWTLEDDLELEELFAKRTPIKELAEYFGRSRGAIASRIKKLELREKYFNP
ncbi:hypothetical protein [Marinoscillum sp.]|uniref:AsnC family protein n=1 Tax=Marinoscillum sp. TaxID=2024838 RepID=UPI003BA93E72